jgi:hypothetical protein
MMKLFHESFPYYLNDDRKNILLILGHSVFVILFLFTFHPTHLEHFKKIIVIGSVIFLVLYATIIWLPKILPDVIGTLSWTIGKHILFTMLQCFVIGIIAPIAIYQLNLAPDPDMTLWQIAMKFQVNMLMYGSVSITLVTFVIRNVMLRASLSNAIQANVELEKIRQMRDQEIVPADSGRIIIHSDTSEKLEIHLPDLLYIESDDNYSTVYWKNGHGLEKKILRVNLKNVETQLDNSFIVRCHRSFIVNINCITHVSGNTNGYKLSIRDTEITVPVSRSKGKEVIEKIHQIKNFTEIR